MIFFPFQKLQLRNLYLLDVDTFPGQLDRLNNPNLLLLTCLATFALLTVPAITPDTALDDAVS
jgi:hypothetical protein